MDYPKIWYIVYYRFDRRDIGGTSVSAVYADCGSRDSICSLNSTITKTELAITTVGNELLNSNSNCMINSVEIIHDCMPRCVDLNFTFSSHSDKVYLKVWNIILQIYTPEIIMMNFIVTSPSFIK